MNLLRTEAPNSLSCFVEFMTPDEPPAAHHEVFCAMLEKIESREMMRVCISTPPGHAKTKFFTRYFAAWYLGRNPHHRYLQGGHSQAFAENEFGKYVRDIVSEPEYAQVFPNVSLSKNSKAAGSWRLAGHRGGYVTKGVGQAISGYRGHIGAIDDPFGSKEDAQSKVIRDKTLNWFKTDFRTRLLPLSPLFVVATRWDPEDLIGAVEYMTRLNPALGWKVFNFPAIIETEEEMLMDPMGRSMGEALWPDFYTLEELLEFKNTLPSGDWQALYQGQPRDPEGKVVKVSWFKRYDRLPTDAVFQGPMGTSVDRQIKRITLSVDCAQKTTARANHSVITAWIQDLRGHHYLADVSRKKLEFTDLIAEIDRMIVKWNPSAVLVEDAGAGTQYIQQMSGKTLAPIIRIEVKGKSKEFRFDAVTPMFEAGEVLLPKWANWLNAYETEILAFPSDKDDQVDSTSQYLSWARKRGNYGTKKLKGMTHAR